MELHEKIGNIIDADADTWCPDCREALRYDDTGEYFCRFGAHPSEKECVKHNAWLDLAGVVRRVREIIEEAI